MAMKVDSRQTPAHDRWTQFDHRVLLPTMSLLPNSWGQTMAAWRGRLHAVLGRDWAERAVGKPYIAERTRRAYAQVCPGLDLDLLVRRRYATVSLEELEAHWIANGRFLERSLDMQPVCRMLAMRPPGRGMVVLTAHFDSFILGMMALGLCGATTHVMTSNIVEDERVHPAVQGHFVRKYREAGKYMAGGGFWHVETSALRFQRALRRGEVVVVVADAPASSQGSDGVWVPWFGQVRRLADGALRLARTTRSPMAALLTVGAGTKSQRWLCHGPLDPWSDPEDDGEAAYRELFSFMETTIRNHPGLWWELICLTIAP